jgi:1-acyl-sn-glycerol-3-phosphate acyltransferase
MFYWLLKNLFGTVVKLVWVKKIDGVENLPKSGAYIIAANHASYFDFLALASVWPSKITFLAGEVFFKKWWWIPLVKWTGQIRVDRENSDKSEVYKKVFFVLKSGGVVGIFPEGTRSADGKIGKAFTGVAKFALQAKVPVVPVGIYGTYQVMSRHDKFPKFKKVIKIKIGKQIYLEGEISDENILRQNTDKIMGEINNLI